MKIFSPGELVWVAVYADEVGNNKSEEYPCIELLIPVKTLKGFLFQKGMSWEYYEKESVTEDFDGLYEFAGDEIVAMRYSI